MSRFFSEKYASLAPYVPGEQPKDKKYIKLNTNESPFPPSPMACSAAAEAVKELQLYSDPECTDLVRTAARMLGIEPEQILFTNGSDEALNFAFMAFCDQKTPAIFPDITYGFYKVFAGINGIPYRQMPLKADFTVDVGDYLACESTVFLANPNAPTGLSLPLEDIEKIVSSNPDRVVVIDEAYVDFGGESALPLIQKYDNLLVVQTFSKSRSLAGGRLGFAVGSKELIRDLKTIQYSTNPYNVNRMTMAAGIGALEDTKYFEENCRKIRENRAWATDALRQMDFTVLDSDTNFILARHSTVGGKALYLRLKEEGILVRHFDTPRLTDYVRITIGSDEQMKILVNTVKKILED